MIFSNNNTFSNRLSIILLIFGFGFVSACGNFNSTSKSAVIEDTPAGLAVLEQEFGECDETEEPFVEDNPRFEMNRQGPINQSVANQNELEKAFPHLYSSIDKLFPNQGSWRKSKQEILDLVDRFIYSPKHNSTVHLLHYFDMVLLINVAQRNQQSVANSSAQRMQVIVRNGNSNVFSNWTRAEVWPISSGKPCGTKRILTPTGVFKLNPSRVYSEYYSNLWEGREMFETFFLYHSKQERDPRTGEHLPTGVAIHGTEATTMLGRQDSGGCIRIARDKAQCLLNSINGTSEACIPGGLNHYEGKTISLEALGGEADPEYLRSGGLEVNGIRIMVAIYDDENDVL